MVPRSGLQSQKLFHVRVERILRLGRSEVQLQFVDHLGPHGDPLAPAVAADLLVNLTAQLP